MTEFVDTSTSTTTGPKLAPFNPTSVECVHQALEMLQIKEGDVLYDLGCGDGRLLIEASKKYGIRGVGIEYDSGLCDKARSKAKQEGVGEQVSIVHANVLDVDISPASVIFVYLVPEGMRAMRERLERAMDERGVRVVTYVFSIPERPPVEVQLYKNIMKLYLYSASRAMVCKQEAGAGVSIVEEQQQQEEEEKEEKDGDEHHVTDDDDTQTQAQTQSEVGEAH